MSYSEMEKDMAKRILKKHCSSWYELRYDEIRHKPYFIGKRFKGSPTEVLLPINCYKAMTSQELKTCVLDSSSSSVNLAIYNNDSTVVLYKAELGLKPPTHLKKNEVCPDPDNSDGVVLPKKRKIDSASESACKEQNKDTNVDQIDMPSTADLDVGEPEKESSEESNDSLNAKVEVILS